MPTFGLTTQHAYDFIVSSMPFRDDIIVHEKMGGHDVFILGRPEYPYKNCIKFNGRIDGPQSGAKSILLNMELPAILDRNGIPCHPVFESYYNQGIFASLIPYFEPILPKSREEYYGQLGDAVEKAAKIQIFLTNHSSRLDPEGAIQPLENNVFVQEFFKPPLLSSVDQDARSAMELYLHGLGTEIDRFGHPALCHGDLNDKNVIFADRRNIRVEYGEQLSLGKDLERIFGLSRREGDVPYPVFLDFKAAWSVPESDLSNYLVRSLSDPAHGLRFHEQLRVEKEMKARFWEAYSMEGDLCPVEKREERYRLMKARAGLNGIRHYLKHHDAAHAAALLDHVAEVLPSDTNKVLTGYLRTTQAWEYLSRR